MQFLTDPRQIETESMAIIRRLLGELPLDPLEKSIVYRVVHTSGDPEMAALVGFSPGAAETGRRRLAAGCSVITDVRMLAAGINKSALARCGSSLYCAMEAAENKPPGVSGTRAMWGMSQLKTVMDGAVVAVGNAPTALAQVLEMAEKGLARPGLIVGTPVGFVGARESKEWLTETAIPWITVRGNRGGSPVAASIINALLYSMTKEG